MNRKIKILLSIPRTIWFNYRYLPMKQAVKLPVWIAANTTVLKGAVIADNTIVASGSLVNKIFNEGGCILGGQPAKVLKKISHFTI